jgi:hypothetical protein
MLKIALLVPLNIGQRISITCSRDKARRINNKRAQVFHIRPKRGKLFRRRPYIRRRVLWEIREIVCWRVLQFFVLVKGAVDIVRALEGIEMAGPKRFFAAGPANEVF